MFNLNITSVLVFVHILYYCSLFSFNVQVLSLYICHYWKRSINYLKTFYSYHNTTFILNFVQKKKSVTYL